MLWLTRTPQLPTARTGEPVSHTPEAYTTLQTIWSLQRKLGTCPHLVHQMWTHFKVIAKPANSACLWPAADMSVRCHPSPWPAESLSQSSETLLCLWEGVHSQPKLHPLPAFTRPCIKLRAVWSFWSTCQASLAGYVAIVIPMAHGQGHLSEKKGPASHFWCKHIVSCKSLFHVHENAINKLQTETSFLKWVWCKNTRYYLKIEFCDQI